MNFDLNIYNLIELKVELFAKFTIFHRFWNKNTFIVKHKTLQEISEKSI